MLHYILGSLEDLPGGSRWIRGGVLLGLFCLMIGTCEQMFSFASASESLKKAWPYLLVSLFGSLWATQAAPPKPVPRGERKRRGGRKARRRPGHSRRPDTSVTEGHERFGKDEPMTARN